MKLGNISILGTEYFATMGTPREDKRLEDCDGYCDKTAKMIVVRNTPEDSDLGDYETYQRKVLRHEVIHAYLFESGLHENWQHEEMGHDETYVDWIATQFPKIMQTFLELGIEK